MSELIKYANTDILDGLKSIRIGLSNIAAHVITTGEEYIIDIPLKITTLKDLLDFDLFKNYYISNCDSKSEENSFIITWGKFKVEVTKTELGYRFRLLK